MTTAERDGVELQTLLPHQADGLTTGAIWVLDGGQEILEYTEVGALAEYLGEYPEAENDGATRLFHYTSKSSMELLVKLFDKYEAWHLKMIAAEDPDHRLEVAGSNETFSVFAGGQKATFRLRPWSIQLVRFPTRRVEHTDSAIDALLYHDDFTNVACAKIPLEYVISVMETTVRNWTLIIETSQRFLGFYSVEALSPRLETDRSIIRHLLGAAQLWKSLLSMVQAQITHLRPINDMAVGDPWLWPGGSEDAEQLLGAARSSFQLLKGYEMSIQQTLLREVDQLIQQMTNLITIDEGYRSRDMNTSIWRLSWVTFIFLPLVFASTVFGMNLDIFRDNPSWWYYFSFVVPLIVVFSALYLGFRYSGSLAAWLKRKPSPASAAEGEDPESLVGANTVLRWAAATGQIDTVAGLLGSRAFTTASSQVMGPASDSPLISAILAGNEPIMRLLVQQNPQTVHETDKQGATALHQAARGCSSPVVEFLLENGASITVKDCDGLTPLDWAIKDGEDKSTAAILRKMYEEDNTADAPPPGATSLHIACVHRDFDITKRLIFAGYNNYSRFPGDSEGRKDAQGRIAPFTAMKQGHDFFVEVAKLYEDHDLAETDYRGQSLFHAAVQLGLLETVKYLVSRGLNVKLKTAGDLDTPLHFITHAPNNADRLAIVQFLCENGASRDHQNAVGSTIAHIIAQEGRPDSASLLQYLIQSEIWRLRVQDELGRTPIHLAATSGHLPAIKQLLSMANPEILLIKSVDGHMAVDVAARAGHLDTFLLLRPHHGHGIEIPDMARFWTLVRALVSKDDLPSLQKAFQLAEAQGQPLALSSRVFQQAIAARAAIIFGWFMGEKPDWIQSQLGQNTSGVLLHAIKSGNADFVDSLLDANVPVKGQDEYGWNVLHEAAFWGLRASTTKRIADSLASDGSSLKDQEDAYDWIPYDLAYFYFREDLYSILAPERLEENSGAWWIGLTT
ncbi:ankyrin [Parathielavia hyrcaniae]|uniref:Ankyrin n=1 Tax=Parathielavia hyrcaniae TaxID=113614 RepID=A0AAN6SY73_9PEZI|nr:ankyrin [Parathielavia hyrcaniae]